jgi:hypothetical protein
VSEIAQADHGTVQQPRLGLRDLTRRRAIGKALPEQPALPIEQRAHLAEPERQRRGIRPRARECAQSIANRGAPASRAVRATHRREAHPQPRIDRRVEGRSRPCRRRRCRMMRVHCFVPSRRPTEVTLGGVYPRFVERRRFRTMSEAWLDGFICFRRI